MGEVAAYRAKRLHAKRVLCDTPFPTAYRAAGGGGGRCKSLSVCVRLGKAKRPHEKEVLHDMLSPAAHGGDM